MNGFLNFNVVFLMAICALPAHVSELLINSFISVLCPLHNFGMFFYLRWKKKNSVWLIDDGLLDVHVDKLFHLCSVSICVCVHICV